MYVASPATSLASPGATSTQKGAYLLARLNAIGIHSNFNLFRNVRVNIMRIHPLSIIDTGGCESTNHVHEDIRHGVVSRGMMYFDEVHRKRDQGYHLPK